MKEKTLGDTQHELLQQVDEKTSEIFANYVETKDIYQKTKKALGRIPSYKVAYSSAKKVVVINETKSTKKIQNFS